MNRLLLVLTVILMMKTQIYSGSELNKLGFRSNKQSECERGLQEHHQIWRISRAAALHWPSQVIMGPGSNPSSQLHSNAPSTFVQVPFPHGFPSSHSFVSDDGERREHTHTRVQVQHTPHQPDHTHELKIKLNWIYTELIQH